VPKLPEKVEDWKAPWETETGESEIEKDKLKRYLFGLLKDKERLQGSNSEKDSKIEELTKAVEAKAREGETDVEKLNREKKDLEDKLAKAGTDSAEVLRLRVALAKGLTEAQAKRLLGSTEEELSKDADELVASFGGNGKKDESDESDDGDVSRKPRGRHNPGDPDPSAGAELVVNADALAKIPRL
jgi:hypothetical protein